MAQCVVPVNLSGVDVLSPAAVEPCTGLVVLTPAEYGAMSQNPFNLSPEDGTLVAAAVVGVWCIGWAMRALARVLSTDGEVNE